MYLNKFLYCVFALYSAVGLCAESKLPNIIVILADDLGFGDVQCNNPESKIPTPNIDRIANEGMRFTDAHTSSGVCTPTRYSLLTGRYHWRTHLQSGVLGGFSKPLIANDRRTLASLFSQKGYHTICIGKWHLGMNWPLRDGRVADDRGDFGKSFSDVASVDYASPIQDGPVDRGFHSFYGISASLDMFPYVWIQDRLPTEIASVEKAFHRKGPAGEKFEAIDVQGGITDRLMSYISERAESSKQGKPFFAYVPLAAPHTPIVPTKEWQDKSRINAYADFVMQVDADMGRLLKTLDQLAISENTLLIFTSDNGCSPAANIKELEAAGHKPSYIYRGHKADLYEGGHRVPFLVRWPGKVKSGSQSDQLIGQLDLMATFAELIGEKLPSQVGEDSVSFLPTLFEQASKNLRTSIISQSINGSFAIRDGRWKLCLCPGSGGWSFPKPGSDDHSGLSPSQLYDLSVDPGETKNLFDSYPERVSAMTKMLETAISRGRSTPGVEQKNDVNIVMIKEISKPSQPKAKKKKGKND